MRKLAALAVVLLLAGCEHEGGPSGTGIDVGESVIVDGRVPMTMIEGNVANVRPGIIEMPDVSGTWLSSLSPWPTAAHADNPLKGIRVEVAGSDRLAITDGNGAFALAGPFGGQAFVIFEGDGWSSVSETFVPRGGRLVLNDVTIDPTSHEADAAQRTIAFEGVVIDTDCSAQRIDMASRWDLRGSIFEVFLGDGSLANENCSSLRHGDELRVEGSMTPALPAISARELEAIADTAPIGE